MNAITAISAAVLMMSSRQIAEETGKEHFHVMRDLRALKNQLGPMFKGSIQNWIHPQNGQSYEEFLIDKDTCLTLLLGYDAVARMKVVKRWQELEAQATPALPDFSNPVAAARAWADAKESELRTAEALALAAPKAEYVDRYVAANGAKGFRQVAKLLGANEHAFRAWLQDEKIMYRLGGEWTAHQCHIDAGRFVVKTGVAQANEHAFNTTKFTPKGVNWVAGLWGQHQARLAQGERA